MKSMYKPNISAAARFVSTAAGAALAAYAFRRAQQRGGSSQGLGMLGTALIARGATGWCPVTAAMNGGRSRSSTEITRERLGGSKGVIVEDAVTINRPIDEVYSYWRSLENLPRFMEHLEEVRVLDRFRSHWVAHGPLGASVEWDAEIINDIPSTLISWKSVGNSEVVSAGSVRFTPVGDSATRLHVKLQYDPPAGKLGATVAWLFGEEPTQQIAEDLRRFKQLLEGSGDAGASGSYRATESSQRVRRQFDPERAGDFESSR